MSSILPRANINPGPGTSLVKNDASVLTSTPTVISSNVLFGPPTGTIAKRVPDTIDDEIAKAIKSGELETAELARPKPSPPPSKVFHGDSAPLGEAAIHKAISSAVREGILTIERRPKTTLSKMARSAAGAVDDDEENINYQIGMQSSMKESKDQAWHISTVTGAGASASPSFPTYWNLNSHVDTFPSGAQWEAESRNSETAREHAQAEAPTPVRASENGASAWASAYLGQAQNSNNTRGIGEDTLKHCGWTIKTPQVIGLMSVIAVMVLAAILVGSAFVMRAARKSKKEKEIVAVGDEDDVKKSNG